MRVICDEWGVFGYTVQVELLLMQLFPKFKTRMTRGKRGNMSFVTAVKKKKRLFHQRAVWKPAEVTQVDCGSFWDFFMFSTRPTESSRVLVLAWLKHLTAFTRDSMGVCERVCNSSLAQVCFWVVTVGTHNLHTRRIIRGKPGEKN